MKVCTRTTLLLTALLSLSCIQSALARPDGALISGEFEVVAIRKASLVHAGPHDISLDPVEPGNRVRFDNTLQWLWDKSCRSWSLQPAGEPVVPLEDGMISDTQVTAARLDKELPDHRINEHMVIRCGPSVAGHILRVDDRVLITISPSGQSYLVLEQVPGGSVTVAVQKALVSMKFYEGEPTGTMDAKTRRALALFAGYLGADYDFNASALSNNLLEALGLKQFIGPTRTLNWSDGQIADEMSRYRFHEPLKSETGTFVVVSEFFETGQQWPAVDTPQERDESPAFQRLLSIRSFLEPLANVEYSVLADQLKLLKSEREGDWDCAIGIGCYPKGYVVGLGPVEADSAAEICGLFRANGWFCAIP